MRIWRTHVWIKSHYISYLYNETHIQVSSQDLQCLYLLDGDHGVEVMDKICYNLIDGGVSCSCKHSKKSFKINYGSA